MKHLTRCLLILLSLLLLPLGCKKADASKASAEIALTGAALKAAEQPDDNNRVFYEIFVV